MSGARQVGEQEEQRGPLDRASYGTGRALPARQQADRSGARFVPEQEPGLLLAFVQLREARGQKGLVTWVIPAVLFAFEVPTTTTARLTPVRADRLHSGVRGTAG